MATEIMRQVNLKVRDHLYFKERKETDFVKGRRSELNLFSAAASSHDNSIKILEYKKNSLKAQMENKDKGEHFDKEAYDKVKQEIKMRKEAKKRLLEQGYPDYKGYIRV